MHYSFWCVISLTGISNKISISGIIAIAYIAIDVESLCARPSNDPTIGGQMATRSPRRAFLLTELKAWIDVSTNKIVSYDWSS